MRKQSTGDRSPERRGPEEGEGKCIADFAEKKYLRERGFV